MKPDSGQVLQRETGDMSKGSRRASANCQPGFPSYRTLFEEFAMGENEMGRVALPIMEMLRQAEVLSLRSKFEDLHANLVTRKASCRSPPSWACPQSCTVRYPREALNRWLMHCRASVTDHLDELLPSPSASADGQKPAEHVLRSSSQTQVPQLDSQALIEEILSELPVRLPYVSDLKDQAQALEHYAHHVAAMIVCEKDTVSKLSANKVFPVLRWCEEQLQFTRTFARDFESENSNEGGIDGKDCAALLEDFEVAYEEYCKLAGHFQWKELLTACWNRNENQLSKAEAADVEGGQSDWGSRTELIFQTRQLVSQIVTAVYGNGARKIGKALVKASQKASKRLRGCAEVLFANKHSGSAQYASLLDENARQELRSCLISKRDVRRSDLADVSLEACIEKPDAHGYRPSKKRRTANADCTVEWSCTKDFEVLAYKGPLPRRWLKDLTRNSERAIHYSFYIRPQHVVKLFQRFCVQFPSYKVEKDTELFCDECKGSDSIVTTEKCQCVSLHLQEIRAADEARQGRFSTILYCLLCRYHSLFGVRREGRGLQSAVTSHVMEVLKQWLKISVECFASPFNANLASYCSIGEDIDPLFGSLGSFFRFIPPNLTGSYEVNPPFDPVVMERAAERLLEWLRTSTGPLSFSVVVPDWSNGPCRYLDLLSSTPYCRRNVLVEAQQHSYISGHQHYCSSNEMEFCAVSASRLFVLQNDKGALEWPTDARFVQEIKEAWKKGPWQE